MTVLQEKEGRSNILLIILVFIILAGVVSSVSGEMCSCHFINETVEIANCTSCHDISSGAHNYINATAMKYGVHRNLNKNATNTTAIDPINKACWACHRNGTEPEPDYNMSEHKAKNYTWQCISCHNATPSFTSPNETLQTEITRKKVYDHIQSPYYESIESTKYNSIVNCTICHNKSKAFTDTIKPKDPLAANVSHYATYTSLIKPTINCTLCHKSLVNSTEWYAKLTRHPAKSQDYTFCDNCHNTTPATSFHDTPLVAIFSIHGGWQAGRGFDWENDDATEGYDESESCYACHNTSGGTPTEFRLCENCHVNLSSIFTGPFNTGLLRSDINDTIPFVYSHISYSNMTGTNVSVPSQKFAGMKDTTCYGYNASTGEATCHGAPYFNRSNFGGYYAQYNDSSAAHSLNEPPHWTVTIDRLPNTTQCLFCHNQSNITIRRNWGNATQINASTMFGATSNDSCYVCHTKSQSIPQDFHSSDVVKGGGPDCLRCHNISNKQNYTKNYGYIDGVNYSNSIHRNINSNNASGYGINASCWACHNSSGYAIANNTHPDRRTTPYICVDCHLESGSKAGAYNATIVYNHYKNGTSIKALDNRTSDIASCIGCHENVSGMKVPNNDTDYGSFAGDGIGLTGGNASFYHYGANRLSFNKIPGSYEYCIYCHRNTTGEFNITFQDRANRSISNHSSYNSNPSCSAGECHNSTNSTLHRSQLARPNLILHNSSYCLSCHGKNTTGGTNYTGAVTTYKEKHNNTVNCTECHLNSSKSIHPVRYLQQDNTWSTSNASAVNCTNCHQSGIANFSSAPKVPDPMAHSENNLNGSIWNNTNPYWINTSQQSMCNYCHGDTKHNITPLGIPVNWKGSNTINSSITNTSNWCAGCHYQGYSSAGKSYANMTQSFEGANKTVPPEITNHSSYAPYTMSNYYNHSLTPDYNDSTCKDCHGRLLSTGAKIKDFMHNVSTGSCTNCHFNYDYMKSVNKSEKYVNSTMFNASPHSSLSCEDCHTKGHKNIGARKACEDCHAYQSDPKNERDRHNITAKPTLYIYNGTSVVNITTCTTCHDETLYNNAISIYGYGKRYDCDYCHTYPDKTYS